MLGTRTKQVSAYGKRGRRIVNVSEDREERPFKPTVLSNVSNATQRNENDYPRSRSPSFAPSLRSNRSSVLVAQSPVQISYKKQTAMRKSRKSPKTVKSANAFPVRHPLGSYVFNVPRSPAIPPAHKRAKYMAFGKGTPLKPNSPIVNVDIMTFDGNGRAIHQERRISRSDVQANPVQKDKGSSKSSITLKLVNDEVKQDPRRRTKRVTKRVLTPIVISSDSSDTDSDFFPSTISPVKKATLKKNSSKPVVVTIVDSDSDYRLESTAVSVPSDNPEPLSHKSDEPVKPPTRRQGSRRNIIATPPSSPESSHEPPDPPTVASKPMKVPVPEFTKSAPPQPSTSFTHDPLPLAATLPAQVNQKVSRTSSVPTYKPSHAIERDNAPLSRHHTSDPSHRNPRPVTPIRSRSSRSHPLPGEIDIDNESSDADDLDNLGEFALSPNTRKLLQTFSIEAPRASKKEKGVAEYLKPLLAECEQTTPHEFSAFIETFPWDPIVQTSHGGLILQSKGKGNGPAKFQKIGEASFSEVFGIGDVVLKVIPLRDEETSTTLSSFNEDNVDTPPPSDAKDVLQEIVVTREMGEICGGFVRLLRSYVVRGKYPSLLLNLWDEYCDTKGSESVRPDMLGVSQVYAIIVLPNGGPDLEAYTFTNASKQGWSQACSLFWQVTKALAQAEDLVQFEHRDLHWGQILVKDISVSQREKHDDKNKKRRRVMMDDDYHGVRATVIDLGLARMDAEDGAHDKVRWTPFDDEVFEGEGDYQFDIYRMMRAHNRNSWKEYRPLSNVMWLHYLTLKLLNSKRLRPPTASRKSAAPSALVSSKNSATFTEKESYECLLEMERLLNDAVAHLKPPAVAKKGRPRKTQKLPSLTMSLVNKGLGLGSALDVLDMGISRGWIS
ncbi:hypothetical protein C8Q75DRAFT_790911 [Abortiporus biennis]|nr:hypothetical protein C8Q75DRAFT_790911 [Abortiporus biennis]